MSGRTRCFPLAACRTPSGDSSAACHTCTFVTRRRPLQPAAAAAAARAGNAPADLLGGRHSTKRNLAKLLLLEGAVRDAADDPALLYGRNALVIAVKYQPNNVLLWHLRQLLAEDVLELEQDTKLDGVAVVYDDVELHLALLFLAAHQAVARHNLTMVQR